MNMHRNNRITMIWSGALMSMLLLVSCGVTAPEDSPWEDVRNFSWPTSVGTMMKYHTEAFDENNIFTESDIELTVKLGSSFDPNHIAVEQQSMYILQDEQDDNWRPYTDGLSYRASEDSLIVLNDPIGISTALISPLEKGRKWIAQYDGQDTGVAAEIIELFSYRKVEGITYRNVVAVKYKVLIASPNAQSPSTEWIRFYAEGIGEIETIKNGYGTSTSSSEPLPEQRASTVLVETTFSTN